MTEHVVDDLELYALGALTEHEADAVTVHLAACPACRESLAELATVVNALPDMVALREPPARLRQRILSAAAGEIPAATRETVWTFRRLRGGLGLAVLGAAVAVLLALDIGSLGELRAAEAERAGYAVIADKLSHGGKNWYMVGLDQWKGSGGTLFAPSRPDLASFVVFHDLRPLSTGAVYAVWLVDADGHWVRGANFRPDGRAVQSVDLTIPVESFAQCAVTLEMSTEGKKAGPVVMQSRIAPPGQ
jgi:hypothetical protein